LKGQLMRLWLIPMIYVGTSAEHCVMLGYRFQLRFCRR
jgi:hypothetical protein